jgi:hypothetical protein
LVHRQLTPDGMGEGRLGRSRPSPLFQVNQSGPNPRRRYRRYSR